jgi:hypothetical protein
MRIDSVGRVGLGVTNPVLRLQVAASNSSVSTAIAATENNYLSGFRSSQLIYNPVDTTGTTYGISNSNLGLLSFLNCTNVLIGTNGETPVIFATTSLERMRITGAGNVGIGTTSPSATLDVVGAIEVNSNVNLNSEATTLATTTKTQVASFAVASFRSGKLIVQAYDSVTGEVHISELLVAHNGTTASSTEYGVVYTGSNPLVVYDVDISSGNVRLMATRTTANSTQYKVSETLMVA